MTLEERAARGCMTVDENMKSLYEWIDEAIEVHGGDETRRTLEKLSGGQKAEDVIAQLFLQIAPLQTEEGRQDPVDIEMDITI